MANEPQIIDGGVFIDTKTDEIVHVKPEEGVQIVPEGGTLDDTARGLLKAVGGDSAVDAVGADSVDLVEVETDIDKMTVAGLKAYADENNIDLGDATVKADILAAINAAE